MQILLLLSDGVFKWKRQGFTSFQMEKVGFSNGKGKDGIELDPIVVEHGQSGLKGNILSFINLLLCL